MKVANKRFSLAPDDQTINSRAKLWKNLFTRFENCNDQEDDGYDMDDLISIAEEEDKENFKDDLTNVEAIEEISNNQRVENFPKDQNERYEKLTFFISPEFLQKAAKEYQERCEELGKMNLPFWHIKKDERYQEQINHFNDGFSAARNYESNTTAIAPLNSTSDPRKDSRFISNVSMPSINPEIFKLPPEIQQIMSNNSVVNFKIREYDLTVCRDPGNASISIKIPTFSLPAISNLKELPETSRDENNQRKFFLNNSPKLLNAIPITIDDSSDSDQPSPKRFRAAKNFDDIKLSDISTAGSSLSTEDDDFFFSGGEARNKQKRLSHKLKKLEERREERIKRIRAEEKMMEEAEEKRKREEAKLRAEEEAKAELERKKQEEDEERIRKEIEEKIRAEAAEKAKLEEQVKVKEQLRLEAEMKRMQEEEARKKLEEKIRKEVEQKIRTEQEAKAKEKEMKEIEQKGKQLLQKLGKDIKVTSSKGQENIQKAAENIEESQKDSTCGEHSDEFKNHSENIKNPSNPKNASIPLKSNQILYDTESSTEDDDDFMEMVGEAIKKHKEKILQERKIAEERRNEMK